MANDDITKPPEKGPGDVLLDVTKTGFAPVPCVGALAVQFLNAIVVPPIQRRYVEWVTSIAERLVALEQEVKSFRRADLEGDESFADTFSHASQAVTRSHQEEKLEALRNAVLNAALPGRPEEDLQMMFLGYVDAMTPRHIRVLDFLNDPNEWSRRHNAGLPTYDESRYGFPEPVFEMCRDAFPELRQPEGMLDQIIDDLDSRGLVRTGRRVTSEYVKRTYSNLTDIGREFLLFISEPQVIGG